MANANKTLKEVKKNKKDKLHTQLPDIGGITTNQLRQAV